MCLELLTWYRYLSQVRQELAMRLLARVYAGGSTPSKVSNTPHLTLFARAVAHSFLVVAELHEEKIHG